MKLFSFIAVLGLLILNCSDSSVDTPIEEDKIINKDWKTGDVISTKPTDTVTSSNPLLNYSSYVTNLKSVSADEGMVEILSDGVKFVMGDTSLEIIDYSSSQLAETRLNYNFLIDNDEVTQAEYFAIMGDSTKLPPSYGVNGVWKTMSKPVGNISLFNALQFCNKRSDFYGLEQVYSITGDKNSFTVDIDYSKNGFALPTNTEWEFVAKKLVLTSGIDIKNSNYLVYGSKDQPLESKNMAAISGLVNFFGNVKEICLSNKVEYKSDSTLNFGVKNFNSNSESFYVLKGGSYKTSFDKINASYRQYVNIANTVEDAGIRCVIRKGNITPESTLVYLPIFDTLYSVDTTFKIDTLFDISTSTAIDTMIALDTVVVYDTIDYGPPLVLDTLMQFDTTLKFEELLLNDTIVSYDTTYIYTDVFKVKQIH